MYLFFFITFNGSYTIHDVNSKLIIQCYHNDTSIKGKSNDNIITDVVNAICSSDKQRSTSVNKKN